MWAQCTEKTDTKWNSHASTNLDASIIRCLVWLGAAVARVVGDDKVEDVVRELVVAGSADLKENTVIFALLVAACNVVLWPDGRVTAASLAIVFAFAGPKCNRLPVSEQPLVSEAVVAATTTIERPVMA